MEELAVFAALTIGYSLLSRKLERFSITGPIVFVTFGLVLSFDAIGIVDFGFENETVLLIGEITLALVLFSDASRMNITDLRGTASLPARLLGIGLPITIMSGAAIAGFFFFGLDFWEAAVLGAILAPTDAGLGKVVVNSPLVPARIRHTINVESGLNDGLATPLFLIFVSLATEEEGFMSADQWISFIFKDIAIGVLVGLVIGLVGSWLLRKSIAAGWITDIYLRLIFPGIAVGAWVFAGLIEGNGFIAAFVAGLITVRVLGEIDEKETDFIEVEGEVLILGVFFIFGSASASIVDDFTALIIIYALLSLTLIRMLPVALSLIGTHLKPASVLFVGWFGPRGLASIVLLLVLLNDAPELTGNTTITKVVVATVLISVFAHGISANPGIRLYHRRVESLDADAVELDEVDKMPTRGKVVPVDSVLDTGRTN